MKVAILGDCDQTAFIKAKELTDSLGFIELVDSPYGSDIAIAPLLTQILKPDEIKAPRLGTLIFHPSPLPYGRGKASIKFAYNRQEPITAATWFWANEKIDGGDICEQEIVKIDHTIRPRLFYENEIIPAMIRTLSRALLSISVGLIRKVPQIECYSTYD
jgi:methionyl-tRNA formyltransferase